jgi:hypothetical protein
VIALLRRPVVACLVLFVAYFGLSLLNDPRASLGVDTGSKIATVHAMDRHGDLDPDVGYWAARFDPSGRFHPLYQTHRSNGKWITVTTLPMLDAAYPLYRLGGLRLALLLPMAGAVLVALGARALARRLAGGDGWAAFWLTGLATPIAIYAGDFWEHAIGAAFMVWAVVLLFDRLEGRCGWRGALGAGLLFGGAFTMRTEALIYAGVATATVCITMLVRTRRLTAPLVTGVAVTAGVVTTAAANYLLEQATIGAAIRSGRAEGTATRAGLLFAQRMHEAAVTTTGLNRFAGPPDLWLGAAVVLLLGLAAIACTRPERPGGAREVSLVLVVASLVLVVSVYIIVWRSGLGFIPGLLTASPLAAVGFFLCWYQRRAWPVIAIALLSMLGVWLTQSLGGANPQWGGRYLLVSSALLAVLGVVGLARAPLRAQAAFVAIAVLVTGLGLAWTSERTHDVAHGFERLVARRDEGVISTDAFLLREGGSFYTNHRRWLTAVAKSDIASAATVMRRAGVHEFALVGLPGEPRPRQLDAFRRGKSTNVEPSVFDMIVTTYRRAGADPARR